MKYKVLLIDNYGREIVAHKVLAENLGEYEANAICERLQAEHVHKSSDWYMVVKQDTRIWRGMEEFI